MTHDQEPKQKRKYHVGMWLFLTVQALFLVWIITGITSAPSGNCGNLDAKTCASATDVGTTIGVSLVFIFWAVTDIILGMVWLVVHFARRDK